MSPVPPVRQRSGGRVALLVVGIVAAVVVVCGGGLGLLYYVGSHSRTGSLAGGNPFASPAATSGGPGGTVIYQDSLTDSSTGWSDDPGHCFYGNDGYHIANGYICYSPAGQQGDVDISVQVTQISGATDYPYGITFRATQHESHYSFFITSDSHWAVSKCDNGNTSCTRPVDFTATNAVRGGLNTSNTLEVRAIGTHFTFYVNGTQVGQLDDTSFASGLVGLEAGSTIECVFTKFTVTRPS